MWKENTYDVVIVGAGIAGCALAHALSTIPSPQPLKIALIERSLAEPDRIVGELLQPGGIEALRKLGLEWTLEGIDAVPARGYCVVDPDGKKVHIPYHPAGVEGRSFHHGKFIMKLREAAFNAKGVDVIEATVTSLVESDSGKRVLGVKTSRKGEDDSKLDETFLSSLTIITDGCFSNFRSAVLGSSFVKPVTKSHFVGLILEDATLPIPQHGTVALCKDQNVVLLYQIGTHETRMLVDVKVPVPNDLKGHIEANIIPSLPSSLRPQVQAALDSDRLRRMPNSFLPPVPQYPTSSFPATLLFSLLKLVGLMSSQPPPKENVILLGDSWNMRHPLTGGGMTVAFNDVVVLRDQLAALLSRTRPSKEDGPLPVLRSWPTLQISVLRPWFMERKNLGATVNILSVALYDLFGGADAELSILRNGCFKYFERGGKCVSEPVGLLSGLLASPLTLFRHFFIVAFYSIYLLFTYPSKQSFIGKIILSFRVFYTAVVVFAPLLWTEMKWWGAGGDGMGRLGILLALGAVGYWYAGLSVDFLSKLLMFIPGQ